MTLEILTAEALLPTRHGFFTRRGGASTGIFKGLNCGQGSSDQSQAVAINRGRVAEAMGVTTENLVSVYQVHSADVVTITSPIEGDKPKVDAMVTNQPRLALGILTADCAPILFSDPDAGVIGAAHSGWKGSMRGVGSATMDAMEALGAKRENISAIVGPCISQRNYEVGEEFLEDFIAEDSAHSRFFAQGRETRKYQFDLPSFVLGALRDAGAGYAEWTGHCTYAEPDRFFSYRRTTHLGEPDYGRLISTIVL